MTVLAALWIAVVGLLWAVLVGPGDGVRMVWPTAVAVAMISWAYDRRCMGCRTAAMSWSGAGVAVVAGVLIVGVPWHLEHPARRPLRSVGPDLPSIGTAVALLVLAARVWWERRWLRVLPALMGAVCLVGYVVGVPALTWHWPGASTAMAVETAVAILLLAAAPLRR